MCFCTPKIYLLGGIPTDGKLIKYLVQTEKEQKYDGNVLIPLGKDIIDLTITKRGYIDLDDSLLKEVYSICKDKKFKEYIGVYQEKTAEGVEDVNKNTYRVITFVEI